MQHLILNNELIILANTNKNKVAFECNFFVVVIMKLSLLIFIWIYHATRITS
jgi:hypothetical protein